MSQIEFKDILNGQSDINLLEDDEEFIAFKNNRESILSNIETLAKVKFGKNAAKQNKLKEEVELILNEQE